MSLFDASFVDTPYAVYEELRQSGVPLWMPADDDLQTSGVWLFASYADVEALLRLAHNDGVSKNVLEVRDEQAQSLFDLNMLNMDGSRHQKMRQMVTGHFSPESLEKKRELMAGVANRLIDAVAEKEKFDFVTDIAEPLPLFVIAELMGIPHSGAAQIRAWFLQASRAFDSVLCTDKAAAQAEKRRCFIAFAAYLDELVANPSELADEGIFKQLVAAQGRGELTRDELVGMAIFLFIAGHETTTSLLSSVLLLLKTHPEQAALLAEQPELMPKAIEEALRLESPVQRSTFRVAKTDIEINGFKVTAGSQITALIGSANRDEAMFENPERFDITRRKNPHLAFGLGSHNCLGKTLARLEAQIAMKAVMERLPKIQLDLEGVRWRGTSFFRSLEALPVIARSI